MTVCSVREPVSGSNGNRKPSVGWTMCLRPVRAMAKIELERTAADRGAGRITVALMEEVKAKYFGLGAKG